MTILQVTEDVKNGTRMNKNNNKMNSVRSNGHKIWRMILTRTILVKG